MVGYLCPVAIFLEGCEATPPKNIKKPSLKLVRCFTVKGNVYSLDSDRFVAELLMEIFVLVNKYLRKESKKFLCLVMSFFFYGFVITFVSYQEYHENLKK